MYFDESMTIDNRIIQSNF